MTKHQDEHCSSEKQSLVREAVAALEAGDSKKAREVFERVVLLFEIWRPEISEEERGLITSMLAVVKEYYSDR